MADIVVLPECPGEVQARARTSGNRSLARLVAQVEVLRELAAGLTAELFERCMADQNGVVQRKLLELEGLSRGQVERLAAAGANRAVRNLAKVRLRQAGYRG